MSSENSVSEEIIHGLPEEPGSAIAASVRPPNRPAHEKLVEELGAKLNGHEERRRYLQDRFKCLRDQQSQFRSSREKVTEERNTVDAKLAAINKEVNSRSEQLQKLRASIPYLSEDRVNEQIKTLEDQMMKHHYKRSEENKIIQEVNRLKRSKKLIKDHNILRSELDNLKRKQRQIRERRDFLFRERGDLKKKEDIVKRDSNEIKEELERIKLETEYLFNAKRQAVADFRLQENEYKKYLYEKRSEQRQKRKEEKKLFLAEKQRELDKIRANAEPFEDELKLVSNLITYCLRFELPSSQDNSNNNINNHSTSNGFLAVPGANPNARRNSHESGLRNGKCVGGLSLSPSTSEAGSSVYATPIGVTPVSTPGVDIKEGGFLYKKEDTEDGWFSSGHKKVSRRNSRNERRNSKVKNLTHNPEIYSQFDSFGLKPPTTTKDVISVISSLKEKQQHFEKMAAEKKAAKGSETSNERGDANPEEVSILEPEPTLNNKSSLELPPPIEITDIDEMELKESEKKCEEAFPCLPEPMINIKNSKNGGFFSKSEESSEMTKDCYKNDLKITESLAELEVQEL